MRITQLHVYPIKSLRGVSLTSASLCAQGLQYDRRYILLKPKPDGSYQNMFVGERPEMALFHCSFSSPTSFTVAYHLPVEPVAPPSRAQQTTLEIPFDPSTTPLERISIEMHKKQDYPAFQMPDDINAWFSECLGYEVILAYMGDGLGVKREDQTAKVWIDTIKPVLASSTDHVNFSDGAALLVVSEASLEDLHPRLGGEKAVLEKFRPNIVVDGTKAWDEDFWGELTNTRLGSKILLTSNCARCLSINVDLDRGRMGEGESGKLLKKMMKDRRIDPGHKWTPIFGKYGFPTEAGEIRVGDEIVVSIRNQEHSVWNGIMPRLAKFDGVRA